MHDPLVADLDKSINLKIVYFATSFNGREGRSYWTIQVCEHFLHLFQKQISPRAISSLQIFFEVISPRKYNQKHHHAAPQLGSAFYLRLILNLLNFNGKQYFRGHRFTT